MQGVGAATPSWASEQGQCCIIFSPGIPDFQHAEKTCLFRQFMYQTSDLIQESETGEDDIHEISSVKNSSSLLEIYVSLSTDTTQVYSLGQVNLTWG